MAKGQVKTEFVLEGEGKYRAAMNDAANALKTLNSEEQLAKANFEATGNAQQYAADKARILKEKIEEQKKAVKAAEDAVKALTDNGVSKNDRAMQNWRRKLNNARTALLKLETRLDGTETELSEQGAAFNNAQADASNYDAELRQVGKGVDFMATIQAIDNVRERIAGVIKGAVKMGKALWDAEVGGADWADNLKTAASQAGLDVETYQSWQYASRFIDTSVDDIVDSRKKLAAALEEPTDETLGLLNELLVKNLGPNGKPREAIDVFWDIVDALDDVESETRKEQIAMGLLGRSYKNINPLVEAGSQAYKDLAEEGRSVAVVSEDNVNALAAFDDATEKLDATFNKTKQTLLADMAPAFTQIADAMSGALQAFNEFLETDEGQAALQNLNDAVGGFADVITGIDFKKALEKATGLITGFSEALKWIGEHADWVVAGLATMGAAWAGLTVTKDVLSFLQLAKSINWSAFGSGASGAADAANAAAAKAQNAAQNATKAGDSFANKAGEAGDAFGKKVGDAADDFNTGADGAGDSFARKIHNALNGYSLPTPGADTADGLTGTGAKSLSPALRSIFKQNFLKPENSKVGELLGNLFMKIPLGLDKFLSATLPARVVGAAVAPALINEQINRKRATMELRQFSDEFAAAVEQVATPGMQALAENVEALGDAYAGSGWNDPAKQDAILRKLQGYDLSALIDPADVAMLDIYGRNSAENAQYDLSDWSALTLRLEQQLKKAGIDVASGALDASALELRGKAADVGKTVADTVSDVVESAAQSAAKEAAKAPTEALQWQQTGLGLQNFARNAALAQVSARDEAFDAAVEAIGTEGAQRVQKLKEGLADAYAGSGWSDFAVAAREIKRLQGLEGLDKLLSPSDLAMLQTFGTSANVYDQNEWEAFLLRTEDQLKDAVFDVASGALDATVLDLTEKVAEEQPEPTALEKALGAAQGALGTYDPAQVDAALRGFAQFRDLLSEGVGGQLDAYLGGTSTLDLGEVASLLDAATAELSAASEDAEAQGANYAAGMAAGIDAGAPDAAAASAGLAQSVADASAAALAEHSPSAVAEVQGENFAVGLAIGIDNRAGEAISAAMALANAVAAALSGALDIHSPSRVAEGMGALFGEGFAVGIEESEARVAAAVGRVVAATERRPAAAAPAPSAPAAPAAGRAPGAAGEDRLVHITLLCDGRAMADILTPYINTNIGLLSTARE